MGMAEIAYVLWKFYLKHNPKNPTWVNRDRFILSNGHGSMLHYALLHLTGYDLPIDELSNLENWVRQPLVIQRLALHLELRLLLAH